MDGIHLRRRPSQHHVSNHTGGVLGDQRQLRDERLDARMRSTNDATSSGCPTNAARTTSAITGWSASRSGRMTTPSATGGGASTAAVASPCSTGSRPARRHPRTRPQRFRRQRRERASGRSGRGARRDTPPTRRRPANVGPAAASRRPKRRTSVAAWIERARRERTSSCHLKFRSLSETHASIPNLSVFSSITDRDLDDAPNEVVERVRSGRDRAEVAVGEAVGLVALLIPVVRALEAPFERRALVEGATDGAGPGGSGHPSGSCRLSGGRAARCRRSRRSATRPARLAPASRIRYGRPTRGRCSRRPCGTAAAARSRASARRPARSPRPRRTRARGDLELEAIRRGGAFLPRS